MKKRIIVIAIITLLLIGIYGITRAENLTELQEQREELQTQIDESVIEIEGIKLELTETLEQINKLNEQIYNYEDEIIKIEDVVKQKEQEINSVEQKLEHLEQKYEEQKRLFQNRIVALYENSETTYLDVLLNSKSIVDFISRYYIIEEIAAHDAELLETVEREKELIELVEQELKGQQTELKELKTEEQKKVISLENAKLVQSSYQNSLTEQEKEIQEKIDEFTKELNKVETEILLLSRENISENYTGGLFAWPAPGYYTITSPYGMRLHPILKVYRSHSGLDIGAPMGADIIAANDGVVIKSTYMSAYGNVIMIDHGGGVVTVYAHGSELVAKLGDTVKRGDVILKCGSTGWSTGPHLHFEIRINGKTIDPFPYITNNINNEEGDVEE